MVPSCVTFEIKKKKQKVMISIKVLGSCKGKMASKKLEHPREWKSGTWDLLSEDSQQCPGLRGSASSTDPRSYTLPSLRSTVSLFQTASTSGNTEPVTDVLPSQFQVPSVPVSWAGPMMQPVTNTLWVRVPSRACLSSQ